MTGPILYRRRLVNAIQNANNRFIYVYGPAGYGKTLAVRQWADDQEKPLVWFEGYATSNISELINSMVDAIGNTVPDLKMKLNDFVMPQEIDDEFISNLFSIISKDRQGFNLVIDNAEIIRESHNSIARTLIQNLPININLVIIFSGVPKTSFISELGIERFTILTPSDLEFTFEEFIQFARQVSSKITQSEAAEIYEFTGGWPAAVHLALNELEMSSNPSDVLLLIRNSGKKKFSTMANRILSILSGEQQNLLLRLCLLPIIETKAAVEITSDDDVIRKLTKICQETVVLRQVSFAPPAFVLHPILRSFLIEILQNDVDFKSKSEKVLEYLISSGDVRNSAKVLLELGSVKRLASFVSEESVSRTINASIQDSIARSAVQEIRDWIPVSDWIPEFGRIAREILSFYVEILSGNFTQADSHLNFMQDELSLMDQKIAEQWSIDVLAMKTISLYSRGYLQEAYDTAMKAYEKKFKIRSTRRHHDVNYLQIALWSSVICDDDEKIRKIQNILDNENMKISLQSRNSTIQSMNSLIAAYQGRIAEAKNLVAGPISNRRPEHFNGFFGNYGTKMAESLVVAESGDIQRSLEILESALNMADQSRNIPMAIALRGRLSYMQFFKTGPEAALQRISEARDMISDNILSEELHSSIDVWEARIRHLIYDKERTKELINRSKQTYLMRAFAAAIQITENPQKALELIDTFDLSYPKQELTYHIFRAHIFGENPRAQLDEVRQAVEVGSKHGYFHHFLTQRSDVMQQYISLAAESPTAFNERLARAAGERLNEMMVGNEQSGGSLTRREADILRHLATGLPLSEIAKNLNISRNTIKTHLRNLYKKLGAENRIDAVEKGKKLLKV